MTFLFCLHYSIYNLHHAIYIQKNTIATTPMPAPINCLLLNFSLNNMNEQTNVNIILPAEITGNIIDAGNFISFNLITP